MSDDKDTKPPRKPPAPRREPEKPRDPFAETVEEAMIDQDIPVETGVRPDTSRR